MLLFKSNVGIENIQPQTVLAMLVAEQVWSSLQKTITVTSVNDSTHMQGSLHYEGKAFDIRIKDLSTTQVNMLFQELKKSLFMGYDVILEVDHIHVEYDPKKASNSPANAIKIPNPAST